MLHHWTRTPAGRLRTEIDGAAFEIVERVGDLHDVVEVFGDGRVWIAAQGIAGLDAAKAEVADLALHRRELAGLGRRRREQGVSDVTPWGGSDAVEVFADGVEFHTTPSHGGFRLSPERNEAVPTPFRRADGWYEEDVDHAAVTLAFPNLFTGRERRLADLIAKNWRPKAYESWSGRALEPGESHVKDRKAHLAAHADDWLAISARSAPQDPDAVLVTASLGGKRFGAETKEFLVPKAEYLAGRQPFAIDPSRHVEADEGAPAPRP